MSAESPMAVAQPVNGRLVDDQVLDIVAGLVTELGGGSARRPTIDIPSIGIWASAASNVWSCCFASSEHSAFGCPIR